ncbi:hypothetical protein DFH09DRAFT_1072324 [Mycena vulgaris]|nr:hypothetical protein DFH09DRAFT_1072324 [Mycena vulgaris]
MNMLSAIVDPSLSTVNATEEICGGGFWRRNMRGKAYRRARSGSVSTLATSRWNTLGGWTWCGLVTVALASLVEINLTYSRDWPAFDATASRTHTKNITVVVLTRVLLLLSGSTAILIINCKAP